MTKVPSRSSVRANHIPPPAAPPITSLCTALSSGDVVKVIVACGFSKPCADVVAPDQRTERKVVSVFSNDCTFTWLIGSLPFVHVHSLLALRINAYSRSVKTVSLCTSSGLNRKIASSCHCNGSAKMLSSNPRRTATMNGSSPSRA